MWTRVICQISVRYDNCNGKSIHTEKSRIEIKIKNICNKNYWSLLSFILLIVYHLFDKLDIPTMLQPQKLSLDTCDIFASKLEKLVTYSQPQFLWAFHLITQHKKSNIKIYPFKMTNTLKCNSNLRLCTQRG